MKMKMSIHNEWIAMRVSRCVAIYVFVLIIQEHIQMSRYIYFGVGRSFGYMDQHMSSQVSAQVKPKGKKELAG